MGNPASKPEMHGPSTNSTFIGTTTTIVPRQRKTHFEPHRSPLDLPPQPLVSEPVIKEFDDLLALTGSGPVPESQVCRICGMHNTRAMLLDCLHSVCGECFAAAVDAHTLLSCPTCQLPSRTHDRAPHRDYVAGHFLAVSDSHRANHVCTVHDKESDPEPATFYCKDCNAFMCSICSAEHCQHPPFQPHVALLLEDLTPEMVSLPMTCPSHGDDRLISGFCTTCRVSVCPTCLSGIDHHTHTIMTADMETSVYYDVCRKLDIELERPLSASKLNGVATTLRTLDEFLTASTAKAQAQHAVIDEWACDETPDVRARAEELRCEVDTKWSVWRQALMTQRRDVAQRVHALAQACIYTTVLRRIGTPREVLAVGPFVRQRVSALRSWLYPIQPCVSRDPILLPRDKPTWLRQVMRNNSHVSEPSVQPWQQGRPPCSDVRIVVVGGFGSDGRLPAVEWYDPGENTSVVSEPALPTPRFRLSCTVHNNRLYALGGWTRRHSDVVEAFDPASRTWDRTCAAMGTARLQHASVTFGDHIYVMGGMSTGDTTVSTVERYHVRANCWEPRANMTTERRALACTVFASHIYATGGRTRRIDKLASVERYDPTRDRWEPVKDMPVGRREHAAAVGEDRLYVIGGATQTEGWAARVDRFDPMRGEWEPVAPLGVGRRELAAVVVGDRIYALCGQKAGGHFADEVEVYDAASNVWTLCKPMVTARQGLAVAAVEVQQTTWSK